MLWIAGILILGHSIIPHHHHNPDQTECNSQQSNRKIALSFTDNSYCNHHETHAEVCHLNQTTIVKDYQTHQAILTINIFSISEITNCKNAQFGLYNSVKPPNILYDQGASRAPPVA